MREWQFQRLETYLNHAIDYALISPETAQQAKEVWQRIFDEFCGQLPQPDVGAGGNRNVVFVWDSRDHHLCLELVPEEPMILFYWNRCTSQHREQEFQKDHIDRTSFLPFL